jgi:hypothetical protein
MRKTFGVSFVILLALIFGQQMFSQGKEKLRLIGGGGDPRRPINLVAEATMPRAVGKNKLNVNFILEKGKISLIGENGLVVGYIGENGRFNLAKGIETLRLFDETNRRVGSVNKNGNFIIDIPSIIDVPKLHIGLIGENGREIGFIGQKGQIIFQKNK